MMKFKDNLPLRYFVISLVILAVFMTWDVCETAMNRAGSLEMAIRTVTGLMPPYTKIENVNSFKIIDVFNADTSEGTGIIQWTDKNGTNQLWQLINVGSGYYKIKNQNSNKILETRDGSVDDGASIMQSSDRVAADSQLWQKITTGSGYFKFQNKKSGKVLDVKNASKDDGAEIIQSTDNDSASQLWRFK
jgi:hypothetical protein